MPTPFDPLFKRSRGFVAFAAVAMFQRHGSVARVSSAAFWDLHWVDLAEFHLPLGGLLPLVA